MNVRSIRSLAAASLVILAFACFASAETVKITFFTNEKTVLIGDKELKGLVDFSYDIRRGATIVTSDESGTLMSYTGDLIEGTIRLNKGSELLDKKLESGKPVDLQYYLSRDKTVKRMDFLGTRITKRETVNAEGSGCLDYYFRSSTLVEQKE